jgi:hypothetical protein
VSNSEISVFIVQVIKLLVCTVCRVLYSEIVILRRPFGIRRMYIYIFLFRMVVIMTSQNIDLSSLDTLYPFGIRRMYIYIFLFRMVVIMTSQNIDLSSLDTLYI